MSETAELQKMTGQQAVSAALFEAMEKDPKVLVFGEDVADREGGGVMGTTRGLSTKFGDMRVRSTPIAEQSIIGAAIGAAMAGYKPVAEIMLPSRRRKLSEAHLARLLYASCEYRFGTNSE